MSYNHYPRGYNGPGGPMSKKPRMDRGPPRNAYPNIGPINPANQEIDKNRLLTFKEYINITEGLDETNSAASYNSYKANYMKERIDKFFKEHQYEEWFKNKYRPEELQKIAEAKKIHKAKRKELFNELINHRDLENFSLDWEHNDKISKFLDEFSLLLEGASIQDCDSNDAKKLYSVSTIYITNLHSTVEKSMIEEYASTHPGFLRVAISDEPDKHNFKRRAWVTYKQMDQESCKKLAWDFNKQKFNGQETRAVVNKELVNRTKMAQYWFRHETCSKADLKNIARLVTYFEGEDSPLLDSIKDFIIEETDEESKLLGIEQTQEAKFEFTQNPEIMKALDKIILYLRCVHSFDYYAATEYVGEDDMPQKVGIMFIRPLVPATFDDQPKESLKLFIDFQKTRIDNYIEKPTLSESDQLLLGKKDVDQAIESFIWQHTVEKVAGEKYACKLTKKRFTAPEYVRKHIFNRCGDKLDEVRADVAFFNNYVADPKRPIILHNEQNKN